MNLFQVPTPNLGLMGRRPQQPGMMMPQSGLEALLAQVNGLPAQPQPMMADAGDEMLARRDQERAAADQAALGGNRPRQRVSGLRVLDRVLGGQTITEGLDAERARLQAEANAPNAMARNQQILQSIEDPRERALFLADPAEWAKNVGQQFAPQVLASGAVQAIGGRAQVGNSQQYDQGDQRRSYDPITGQDTLVNQRGPTIAERNAQYVAETGRINALNPVNVAPGGQLRDPQTGELIAQGADRVFSASDATDLVNERGQPIYQNQRDAPTQRPAAALEIENRVSAINTDVTPTLGRMRSLLESGDVITGLGAEARLNADRALAAIGNQDAQRRVAATEEYRNTAARLRVGMAKSLGANPSNADLTILEQVTGGNIGQNRESLLATIAQGEQMSQRQLTAAQQQLQQFGGQGASPQAQSGIVSVNSAAEAAALPVGTRFRTPDGRVIERR